MVLPSGWMKTYPRIGMRPDRAGHPPLASEHGGDGPLALVMTYPYYLHLADLAWPDRWSTSTSTIIGSTGPRSPTR